MKDISQDQEETGIWIGHGANKSEKEIIYLKNFMTTMRLRQTPGI